MDVLNVNVLVLAYLGDAVYEIYVREELIKRNISNVNDLQTESISYVSAKSQAFFLNKLIETDFLTEEELNFVKRGRNYKAGKHPKNCDIVTYKHATALECLIGYLYFIKNNKRIDEIMNFIFEKETVC